MRIAVTGANGFIGRALVPALRARGHEPVSLERAAIGDIATLAFHDWYQRLAGVDAVVHLAALAHSRHVDAARLRAVNVEATAALGRGAAQAGARLLFMSSVKALGEESGDAPFHETSNASPQDAYGRAKLEAERVIRAAAGLKFTILRPPLVYGPGVKANFLALLKAVARGLPLPLAGIDNRRSLVYVENLADAALRCLESPRALGRTYHVSDGAPLSTPGLCRALGAALGRPARLFPAPRVLLELAPSARKLTRSLEIDDGPLRRELGWTPPCTVEEGLRRTAEWWRSGSA